MAEEEKRKSIIDIEVKGVESLNEASDGYSELEKNIGAVNNEIEENRKKLKELKKNYSENATEIAKLELKNKELTKQKKELSDANNETSKTFASLRYNLNRATGGFLDLFKLLLTNPIGIIITAVTTLIGVFSRSQTGIEFFRKASAFLGTVLGKLSDIVESLGATMIQAFEDPQQALADLVNTIQSGIVKYFTEIIPNAINTTLEGFGILGTAIKQLFEGEFSAAADTALQGITKIVDGVTDLNPGTFIVKQLALSIKDFAIEANEAANSAFRLQAAMIANEKALADVQVLAAKNRVEFVKLKTATDDITLSTEERIAAAEKAFDIENKTLNEQLRLQQERVDLLKAQNDLTNSTEEDIQRVRDAEIVLAQIQEASLNKQLELKNKVNALRQQEIILAEQLADREQTAANELQLFLLEQNNLLIEAEAERRRILLENEELTQSERQLIIAQSEARIKEIKKDADEQEIARAKAVRDAKIKTNKESFGAITGLFREATIAGKTFALAQIGISQGEAIAGLIANAERNPTGALTFGLTNALHFAAGIARIGSAISQAKQVIQSGNSAASISANGISGVNAARQAASAPEGTGLSNVNATLLDQFSAPGRQAQLQSDALALSLKSMPSPVVYVDDINTGQNNYATKIREATA